MVFSLERSDGKKSWDQKLLPRGFLPSEILLEFFFGISDN